MDLSIREEIAHLIGLTVDPLQDEIEELKERVSSLEGDSENELLETYEKPQKNSLSFEHRVKDVEEKPYAEHSILQEDTRFKTLERAYESGRLSEEEYNKHKAYILSNPYTRPTISE